MFKKRSRKSSHERLMACKQNLYLFASALLAPVLTPNMFRWVACQIVALEDCLDYPTLRTTLDSLPQE
jgi:hypothetical protein